MVAVDSRGIETGVHKIAVEPADNTDDHVEVNCLLAVTASAVVIPEAADRSIVVKHNHGQIPPFLRGAENAALLLLGNVGWKAWNLGWIRARSSPNPVSLACLSLTMYPLMDPKCVSDSGPPPFFATTRSASELVLGTKFRVRPASGLSGDWFHEFAARTF
jgi:hypothetical protein